MFTKEIVSRIFNENKGKNFIIATNISVGHGINGVSYTTFYGRNHWGESRRYGADIPRYNDSEIIEFNDSCVVLKNSVDDNQYNSGVFVRYIPYENINCISFIEKSERLGAKL